MENTLKVQSALGIAPPERRSTMRLSDGRVFAWCEWGPAHGTPVLFCTGAGMSGSLGFGTSLLADLGLRLLAPDRPGLGASDAHPGKTLDTWAGDVRELAEEARLSEVAAVGFSQGAPFALALANVKVARAVAIVSGQDDLQHAKLAPLLSPDIAGLLAAAREDAAGFERHLTERMTADVLWQLVFDTSAEHDRVLYGGAAFAEAYRRALREGFSRGPAGYARDTLNALRPWPFAPEAITAPVDVWYGALDASPVHSPDFGATLATRLPRASLTVEPREGGSLLWTRARDILTRLGDRLATEA